MTAFRTIIDTQALVYLSRLDAQLAVWELLPNLFHQLLVPLEVVIEFNKGLDRYPQDFEVADRIDRSDFLKKCTEFDSVTLQFMKSTPDVHSGEAEAVAQHKAVGADSIWSDDKPFSKEVKRLLPDVKIINTLHVVAMLDLLGYLRDFNGFVKNLYRIRPINEGHFIHCYRDAARNLGFTITQKELAAKINFEKIGIKNL